MDIQGYTAWTPMRVVFRSSNFFLGMCDFDEGRRFREKWELPEKASVRYERGRQFAALVKNKRHRTFAKYKSLKNAGVIL